MSPLAAIGVGASLPAFSIIFGRIFNVFYEDKDEIEGKVTLYSLIFVAIGAFAFVCNFGMVRGFFFLPFNTPPYFLRRRKRNGRCADEEFTSSQSACFNNVGERLIRELRQRYFHSLLRSAVPSRYSLLRLPPHLGIGDFGSPFKRSVD
jgi:hypothetical protein